MKCESSDQKYHILISERSLGTIFQVVTNYVFLETAWACCLVSLKCHVLIVLLLSVTVRGRMLNSKYVGVWRAAKCKNTFTTMSKFINFNATREITDLCCWIRI